MNLRLLILSGIALQAQPSTPQAPSLSSAPPLRAPDTSLSTFAWGDAQSDGLPDALVLTPGEPLRLLVNKGDGVFADETERAGLGRRFGVGEAHWRDVDGDGRVDVLLVAPQAGAQLLLQRPGLLFEEVGADAGLPTADVLSARFVDLDQDERPDLELLGRAEDVLLRNLGAGRFERIALDALPRRSVVVSADVPDDVRPRTDAAPASARDEARGARDVDGANASASAPGGVGTAAAGSRAAAAAAAFCAPTLLDQATAGCLQASSLPTLGTLHPLSIDLNVDAAGRVGMGTTFPSHRLTIQAAPGDDALRMIGTQGTFGHGARLNIGDGDYVHLWEYDDDRLEIKGDKEVLLTALNGEVNVASGKLNVAASGGTRIVSGNLGVGPTPPVWPIHVSAPQGVVRLDSTSSTNGSVLELRNQSASPSSIGAINFVNAAGAFVGQLAYSGSNDMTLRTNGSERMRVDALGKVSVLGDELSLGTGLALPVARLLVSGVASLTSLGNLGLSSPTIRAENLSTGSAIAFYGITSGSDATAVLTQKGSGPILRGFNGPESGGTLVFEVRKSGRVVTTALQITGGGDLVESFETSGPACEPGCVVVIDAARPGRLALSSTPYDRRVAGVVSGAGGVQPGIELVQQGVLEGDTQVAMAGRVYVRCTTENGPIEPGDLLTTSSLPGTAMRADDPARAFGAVIGKAMGSLGSGQGLVLVLVNLQ